MCSGLDMADLLSADRLKDRGPTAQNANSVRWRVENTAAEGSPWSGAEAWRVALTGMALPGVQAFTCKHLQHNSRRGCRYVVVDSLCAFSQTSFHGREAAMGPICEAKGARLQVHAFETDHADGLRLTFLTLVHPSLSRTVTHC